jgi:magnesium transporter
VALRDATDEELRQMQREFDLHELAVEDARHGHQRLYDLKRRASVLRHVVAPLLEVAGKLHGGRVPAVCARSQEYFRDVHDHLARINDAIVSAAGILFWRFRRAGWL